MPRKMTYFNNRRWHRTAHAPGSGPIYEGDILQAAGEIFSLASLSGIASIPVEGSAIVQAHVERLKGSNGSGTAHIMCPVPQTGPCAIASQSDLDKVIVRINGVEQAVELVARGQHPNGNYKVVQGWVSVPSVSDGSPIAATIEFGGSPSVPRTTVGGKYTYVPSREDPRLGGYPDVVLVPTDPEYLVTTELTIPVQLQTRDSIVALGGRFATYWHRLEDLSDWWWSSNAGSGVHGLAPASPNTLAYDMCNINNQNYGGFGDLRPSGNDYANWRVAVGYVTFQQYPFNSYDLGRAYLDAWCATGGSFKKFGARGLSYIAVYTHEFCKKGTMDQGIAGVDGYKAFPDGVAAYYLLTGDEVARDVVEWMADRFYRALVLYFAANNGIGYSALLSDPNCATGNTYDARESLRALQCALAGHRIRSTTTFDGSNRYAIDYAAKAEMCKNRLLQTGQENYARKADGTFRNTRCCDQSGMFLNLFMDAQMNVELIKYYNQIDPDPNIVSALQTTWSTMYGSYFKLFSGDSVKSFRNDFNNNCGGEGSGSIDLTLMYPATPAWLYKQTGNATYLAQADEVFSEGVGIGMGQGQGPTIDEVGLYARKIMGEVHHCSMPYFTWRLG